MEVARLEETNFWFRSRNQLILWVLKHYCDNFSSLFEIDCRTGHVLSDISKQFPHATLQRSDIFIAGLSFAATRLSLAGLIKMDTRNIPYEFDVIGASMFWNTWSKMKLSWLKFIQH